MMTPHALTPAPPTSPSAIARPAAAGVLLTTGIACQLNEGFYCPRAMLPLATALCCAFAVFLRPPARLTRWIPRLTWGLCGMLVLTTAWSYPGARWEASSRPEIRQLAEAWNGLGWSSGLGPTWSAFGAVLRAEWAAGEWPTRLGLLVVSGLCGVASLGRRRSWLFAAAVAGYVALGAGWIQSRPNPRIDVFVFQQEGCEALLQGRNPYASVYTDLYGGRNPSFPADWHKDGKVQVGYVYPPLTLLLDIGSYALCGDHRFAQLCALGLALWLFGTCRPGPYPKLAVLALMSAGRPFRVLELGFTEPFTALGIAMTLYAALRIPRAVPLAFGFLISTKQYTLFLLPLGLLLVPVWNRRTIGAFGAKSALTAAILSLPLALWDWNAFFQSCALTQFHTTFRHDSLSYLARLAYAGVSVPVLLRLVGITFLATFGTVAISLVRFRRTPAAFVAASMATYLLFFAFNKQSLAHYYMVVFASGAGLIAALDLPQDAESGSAQPSD